MKTFPSISAFRYAYFTSTVATSIPLAAAMEAIVFTDEAAVVGADLRRFVRFLPIPFWILSSGTLHLD